MADDAPPRATLDDDFEKEAIARTLKDAAFTREAISVLDAHHIANVQVAWLWELVRETFVAFSELPGPKAVIARATRDFPDEKKRLPYLKTANELFKRTTTSPRVALDEIRRFAKMATIMDGLTGAAKAISSSDADEAERVVRESLGKIPRERDYEILRWNEEWEVRMARRRHLAEHPEERKVVPTGLHKLDRILGGGLMPEEFMSILANTGVGKSLLLMNIGYHAMWRGLRVVKFNFEMRADQVAMRYDARFSTLRYDKFKRWGFTEDELVALGRRVERYMPKLGPLRIVTMPMRRADISLVRAALTDVSNETEGVDLVLLDSADHMVSTVRHKEIRLDQAEVYWESKGLAQDFKVPVVTSTHAGREWAGKRATSEAAGESYDKSRITDIVASLFAKKKRKAREEDAAEDGDVEEAEDAPPGLELHLAKYRDGACNIPIPLEADLARMIIKASEEEDEEERAA